MTKLQKKDEEIARLSQRVAELEGLIEEVVRLHYPERWKALQALHPPPWVQELLARDQQRAASGVLDVAGRDPGA
jgi:hypothetical protein